MQADNIIVIIQQWQDSKQVELSKLNPDKAYIQVTHAEPYFDNYGKKSFFCIFQLYFVNNFRITRQ